MATPKNTTPSVTYPVTLQGTDHQGWTLTIPEGQHTQFLTRMIGEPLPLTLKGTKGSASMTVEVVDEENTSTDEEKK